MRSKIHFTVTSIFLALLVVRFWYVFSDLKKTSWEEYSGKILEVYGTVLSEPLIKDFNQTFVVTSKEIDHEKREVSLKVQTDRYVHYEYGDELILTGKLVSPRNFKSDSGRTFNYIDYLRKDDIYFEMKKPSIQKIGGEKKKTLKGFLFALKQKFLGNIKRVLGEPHAALAGGLVVGEKSALGNELIDEFRIVGLIHIVVLSGYNITIVADSIRKVLSFLPRTIGILLGGCGIFAFGILVGGGATVVRSCIMALVALLGTLARRDYNVTRALFLAAFFMLLENPLILLYDPSFQLSFLATLGLILLSSRVEKRLTLITEKYGIRSLVASTLATQIFVSPYILYMMGQLSVIGIVVNILVLPIVPLTMLTVFLTGVLGFISYHLSLIPGWISHILLSYELFMVHFFSQFPFASLEVPQFSGWLVVLCYTVYFVALAKFPSMFSQLRFKKKSST